MMYAMRKDRIMGDTRRRSRAVMSGADRRSSQRSGQPRRRPEQRNQMGDDRDKTQRQQSAQRKRPSGSTSANGRRSVNGRPSQKRRSRKRAKRGFASWSPGKKAVAILMGVLILLITATVAVVAAKWGKIGGVALNPDKLAISEEAEISGTGYLTVALFGLDTRATDEEMGARSDTIMVASLNRETKEIKLVSVYRDTLLQLSDGTYNKANAAYAYGGEEEAVAMLNKNLDLNIEHYVSVDFSVLVHVIDALGGIDINVEEAENGMDIIPYLNNYVVEVIKNTGVDSAPFTQLGQQHLNGVQATAYARLRYGGGDDYKRTERQRQVLEQIAIKAQKAKLSTINKIIDKVLERTIIHRLLRYKVSVRIFPTPRMIRENLTIQNMMSMDILRIIPDMTAATQITVMELADIRTVAMEMAALVMGIQKIPAVIMYLRQMAAVQTVEAATVIPRYRIPEPATVVIPVERA